MRDLVQQSIHQAMRPGLRQTPEHEETSQPTVGCIIPAYNEADSIASVLDSLLMQTRMPDVIHVIVNNSTDDTVQIAGHYAGVHRREYQGDHQTTEIFIHDIGENPDKKVGALNYGFALVECCDFLLGVDGDTTADPRAIESLLEEIHSDNRIGGISAIYSIDDTDTQGGLLGKFLIAGQRAQFAAFNMQNLLRGRNMAVLGGQFSIFSIDALRTVVTQTHQRSPWVKDSEVEDSLLSLQIKSAGYLTKISAFARANVGGMNTLRSLDAQQVKWNFGAIELMWPGQRGDTKGQPFHPNLRLRWFEHLSMVLNLITRLGFLLMFCASMSIGAFVFYWWWLVPPAVATLLNFRVARSMANSNAKDYTFALSVVLAEFYMWIRLGHFLRSWTRFFSGSKTDNWAAQARAERGAGHGYLAPLMIGLVIFACLAGIWTQLSLDTKSNVLEIGWPILGIITILQTGWMFLKALRRYRGYKV